MRSLTISKTVTDRSSNSLKVYLNELNNIDVLSSDAEYEIAEKAKGGDEKARELLVKHNLRFVVSVAKQYQNYGVNFEDLINEGNLGLIKASKTFEPSMGFKFISYAVWRIRAEIMLLINESGKTIRLPSNKLIKNNQIKNIFNQLEQKLERPPSYDELKNYLNNDFTDGEIDFFVNDYVGGSKSLDSTLSSDEGSNTLLEVMSDTSIPSTEHLLDENDSKMRVDVITKVLRPVEKLVISKLYGLNGEEVSTLNDIANHLNVTTPRVAVIRDNALRKMKVKLRNEAKWIK